MTKKQVRFALALLSTLMTRGHSQEEAAIIVDDFCCKLKGERFTVPAPKE